MATNASVEASVYIAATPEQAFGELIDTEGQGRWMLSTKIYPVEGGVAAPDVGSRLVAFTGFAGIGILDVMEVTEHEPSRRWVVAHQGRVIRGSGIFTVDPAPGGSTVHWTEQLELPFGIIGRIGWPLVRPAVRWGLRHSLRQFARLLTAS
jgi:hypothetical protein